MFSKESQVLVVDDSMGFRALIKTQLKDMGFKNVSEAVNGEEAMNFINSTVELGITIDLIICDWQMPGLSGIGLLTNLKKDPKTASIPFLMVTTVSATDQVMAAIKAGVSDYVIKPFDDETLGKKLEAIWKRKFGT